MTESNGGRVASAAMAPSPQNHFHSAHARLLAESFSHWTGRSLLSDVSDMTVFAQALYEAPFVVASHGCEVDPIFNYGNRQALALWETDWQTFTNMPSRLSAEPVAQEERARLLARVTAHGFIDDYSGVRISAGGRRFRVKGATVWNVIDSQGCNRGQAVMFREWEYL